MSDLKNALASLDDNNLAHWTDSGEPRLDVVKSILRDKSITRADIIAAGGRVRNMVSGPVKTPMTPEAAAIAADAAEAAVIAAREKVAAQKVTLRNLRGKLADALTIFNGFTPRKTVSDLVRENSLRERTRKLAEINGEIEPEAVQYVQPQSHLDAVLMGGRGNANRGYKRPYPSFALGTKLPSQR
jgi:hypothetical protein